MIKKFDYENELSFKISRQAYYNAIYHLSEKTKMPLVRVVETFTIKQKWFSEESLGNNITKRSRIRKTFWKDVNPDFLEYTTKYYLKDHRIEINSKLKESEYDILDKIVYKDIKEDVKLRSILEDMETGKKYTADVKDGEDFVTIEIEFCSKEEKDKFVIPEWLK